MPKRTSKKENRKKDEDINSLAKNIVDKVTEEPAEKNPASVAFGRLGGLKGGKARAEKITAKERKEIDKKAAQVRWSKKT